VTVCAIDWYGISAVISATFAGLAVFIGAFNHRTVSNIDAKTDTPGDPRTLGQVAADVAKEVAPPDDPRPPAP